MAGEFLITNQYKNHPHPLHIGTIATLLHLCAPSRILSHLFDPNWSIYHSTIITLSSSLSLFLYMNNLHTKKQLQLQLMEVKYHPRVLLDLSLQNHMMENNSYVAMDKQLGLILDPFDPKFAPLLQQCG